MLGHFEFFQKGTLTVEVNFKITRKIILCSLTWSHPYLNLVERSNKCPLSENSTCLSIFDSNFKKIGGYFSLDHFENHYPYSDYHKLQSFRWIVQIEDKEKYLDHLKLIKNLLYFSSSEQVIVLIKFYIKSCIQPPGLVM